MTTTDQDVVDKIVADLRDLVRAESKAAVRRLQDNIERAIEKAGENLKTKLTSPSPEKPGKE
jgi:hypothetical protein